MTRRDKARYIVCVAMWAVIYIYYPSPIVVLLFIVHAFATIYFGRRLDHYVSRRFNRPLQ